MTELLDAPELTEDEQLIDDTTKKVVQRLYNMPKDHSLDAPQHYDRMSNPGLTDEQIIAKKVQATLYSTFAAETERRKDPREIVPKLANDLLVLIEEHPDKIATKDFALLHDAFETIAKTTDFLQSKNISEIQSDNQLISRYVAATREFILASPSGGDLLAADTEDSRNAFRVYLAVESAVKGDLETAKGMSADVDGHQKESPLEIILLAKLEEAELERAAEVDKIAPETSAANMATLLLHATHETIQQVEQADPHITIGTTLATLKEILAPGGRYMTSGEIHILSAGQELHNEDTRGRTNSGYNLNRMKAETALGHSTNIFLPKIIYGALTSDLQADRASGYGNVTLHLRSEVTKDPATTFTYGDSLLSGYGIEDRVKSKQLTAEDALVAYAYRVEQENGVKFTRDYIEAQVAGVDLDKIDKVSIVIIKSGAGELKANVDAVKDCIDKGIATEAIIDLPSWGVQRAVQHRVDSGMNEDEAVATTVQRLRSNFEDYGDNPLLSLVFVFSDDAELPENHFEYSGKINRELFAKRGVVIREPKVGD